MSLVVRCSIEAYCSGQKRDTGLMEYWLMPWRATLSVAAATLETTLVMQKSLAGLTGMSGFEPLDENRLRDAFHSAADVNLRRWGDTAEMLQNLPSWYRDLGRMPGDLMTDWFDAHHRTASTD